MATADERPSGGNGCLVLAMIGGVLLIAAGVAIETLDFSSPPAPAQAPVALGDEPPEPAPEGSLPIEAQPVEPARPWFDPTPEPLPILFSAVSLESGAHCTLTLSVARGQNEIVARSMRLRCGESTVAAGAVSQADVREIPLGEGWYAYRASLDTGLVEIDSSERRLMIAGAGSYLLDDLSVPRRWAPFLDANAALVATLQHRLVRRAVPFTVEGEAPAAITDAMRPEADDQARCELVGDAVTLDEPVDCRLLLRCGATLLYGASRSGYIGCTVRDGRMITADDAGTSPEDTDARVHLDADRGILEVSDEDDAGVWSARFRLEEDPRCAPAGTFHGWAIDAEGSELSFVLDATRSSPSLRWTGGALDGALETVLVTPDCASGALQLVTVGLSGAATTPSTYYVRYGPDLRSFAGSRAGTGAGALVLWARRD